MFFHRHRLLLYVPSLLLALGGIASGASAGDTEQSAQVRAAGIAENFRSPPAGLPARTLALALRAFDRAVARGQTAARVLTIIDFSLPSTEKRLWVLDLTRGRVLFNELVAHGQQTGENLAHAFSNEPGSLQSSLGVFLTGATYIGKHGLSLKLRGMEQGINDRAEERAIVVHGADYVSDDFARRQGRIGRSHGCPALPRGIAGKVINAIRGGTLLFAYHPDADYEQVSAYLTAAKD
jgi:hypothetical protein